jgi:hypothetical protein
LQYLGVAAAVKPDYMSRYVAWALEFRRYRMTENMSKSRPDLGLRLEFAAPVTWPTPLGQLSHFGHGAFVADEYDNDSHRSTRRPAAARG